MAGTFAGDSDDFGAYYRIRIKKGWFRGKDVFTERLHWYETELISHDRVLLPLNAGNMIYEMMQQLEAGVDWEKQAALMRTYRDLVYRLSYTTVIWRRNDMNYLSFEGQKSDVMWTLSFISQVFPEEPMTCLTDGFENGGMTAFAVRNGEYVGRNAIELTGFNALPDIWAVEESDVSAEDVPEYDSGTVPESGERFGLPDGRVAEYVRMDERFRIAGEYGIKCPTIIRHNVTASLIKDFEDIIEHQTDVGYDVWQLRYSAFMNKTHDIEAGIGGLEPTAYDVLPIAEKGLPPASPETVTRTNGMDRNSLRYIYDGLVSGDLEKTFMKKLGRDAVSTVRMRQNGYETEYRTYTATGTPEDRAIAVFQKDINRLYEDFAELDVLKIYVFPPDLYASLCNVPKAKRGSGAGNWDSERLRLFGKGYADFLDMKIGITRDKKMAQLYREARRLLNERYFRRG